MKYLAVFLCLCCVAVSSIGQENYDGPLKARLQRLTLTSLESFYSLVIEAACEPEHSEIFINTLKERNTVDNSVFMPNYQNGINNQAAVYSLEHYIETFTELYKKQLTEKQDNPDALEIVLSNAKYKKTQFTDNHYGVIVQVEYTFYIRSYGESIYSGQSESIVVFEDMTSPSLFKIKQISPRNTGKTQQRQQQPAPQKKPVARDNQNHQTNRVQSEPVVGYVLDSSGRPLFGALVKVGERYVLSERDGSFKSNDIKEGDRITAEKSNYVTNTETYRGRILYIRLQTRTEYIKETQSQSKTQTPIIGYVYKADTGKPYVGALVKGNGNSYVLTEKDGSFRLPDISKGDRVTVEITGFGKASQVYNGTLMRIYVSKAGTSNHSNSPNTYGNSQQIKQNGSLIQVYESNRSTRNCTGYVRKLNGKPAQNTLITNKRTYESVLTDANGFFSFKKGVLRNDVICIQRAGFGEVSYKWKGKEVEIVVPNE